MFDGGIRRIAFLDRDGTINMKALEGEYVLEPSQVKLVDGAAKALRELSMHYELVVVTNQRCIARGLASAADVEAVNSEILRQLGRDVPIAGVYVCPHEVDSCDCRKPAPGLLLEALRDHPAVTAANSVMIGDANSDILAGRAAGVRTIRIGPTSDPDAHRTVETLVQAADLALAFISDSGDA